MFGKIIEFAKGKSELDMGRDGEISERDMQITAVVILLSMAHIDDDFSPEEFTALLSGMTQQFGLTGAEAGEMMEVADFLLRDRGKIDEFIDNVNLYFELDQKMLVLTMLWKLVLADGRVDKFETRYAVEIRSSLKLTAEQAARARELAE